MKKRYLLFTIVPTILISLVGCSKTNDSLTYGTYITQSKETLKELSSSELNEKAKNEKEVFLLAVYQGQYSKTCNCWIVFENIIVSYMNTYHEMVYLFNGQEQSETVSSLNIAKINESTPYLYVFNGERQIASFSYKNSQDKAIFEDTTAQAMNKRIHSKVNKPELYYVDDKYLDQNLKNRSKSIVLYARNGCGDCSYVLPNVIIPYIKKTSFSEGILVFDMQNYYEQSISPGSEESQNIYQSIKDKYELSASSNATFGYRQGVVPTIHYYESGVVKDTTVFFNDLVDKKDYGKYYVSDSYYSNERLSNLTYLKGASFQTVLKGMELNNADVIEVNESTYIWSQAAATKYHTPFLEAFLNYYKY